MAVSENDLVVGPLRPNEGVTLISLDFFFEKNEWVEVYMAGSNTPLIQNIDYTIAGEGTGTGQVILTSPADGNTLYAIYLGVPLERSSDMQLRGEFKSGPFNIEMDRIWQRLQRHWTEIQRTFRYGPTGTGPLFYLADDETSVSVTVPYPSIVVSETNDPYPQVTMELI